MATTNELGRLLQQAELLTQQLRRDDAVATNMSDLQGLMRRIVRFPNILEWREMQSAGKRDSEDPSSDEVAHARTIAARLYPHASVRSQEGLGELAAVLADLHTGTSAERQHS